VIETPTAARHIDLGVLRRTAAAAVLPVLLAGCGPAGDAGRSSVPVPSATGDRSPSRAAAHTFAVVGDSITAGGTAEADSTAGDQVQGDASWVPAAEQASGLDLVAGWAVPGATTAQMLAGVTTGDWPADVLVVMAGTNDLVRGLPWEGSAADIEGIVAAVDAPVVVVVAIAPHDPRPAARNGYNAALMHLAVGHGWTYLDPWVDVDAGGAFTPGASEDGVHPTSAVAADVGDRIGETLAGLG
jgi:acyl-CoA thioesterase-1